MECPPHLSLPAPFSVAYCVSRRLRLQELSGVFSGHLGLKDFLVLVTPPTPKTSKGGFLKLFSDRVQGSVVGIPGFSAFLSFFVEVSIVIYYTY